jgi:hypothetical protein
MSSLLWLSPPDTVVFLQTVPSVGTSTFGTASTVLIPPVFFESSYFYKESSNPRPAAPAYLSMSYAVDFAASGKPDIQGNIPVLNDLDALNNAIKLWLGSFRGERLYNPRKGGLIIGYLLKPMSEEIAGDMKRAIREGLKHDFVPSVKVSRCEVDVDYENNRYIINLTGYCPSLNSDVHYTDTINSLR